MYRQVLPPTSTSMGHRAILVGCTMPHVVIIGKVSLTCHDEVAIVEYSIQRSWRRIENTLNLSVQRGDWNSRNHCSEYSRVVRLLICEPTRVMRGRLEQCNGLNMQPLLARQYSQWLILIFKKGKRCAVIHKKETLSTYWCNTPKYGTQLRR